MSDEPRDPERDAVPPRFRLRPVVRPAHEPEARQVSRDETDEGWGDRPTGRDDEWYRRERPPHHA